MCSCGCVFRTEVDAKCLPQSHFTFLRQSLLLNPELMDMSRLISQWAPGIHLSLLLQPWDHRWASPRQHLHCCWGSELRSKQVCKASTVWTEPSSQPGIVFWNETGFKSIVVVCACSPSTWEMEPEQQFSVILGCISSSRIAWATWNLLKARYKRGLERWLGGWQHLLFFQRTWVWSSAPNGRS